MKLISYIVYCSLGFSYSFFLVGVCKNKIPVSVKKISDTDTSPVAVKITDANNNLISKITFKKNSDRAAKKLFFCFDDNKTINKVEVEHARKKFFLIGGVTNKDQESLKGGTLAIDLDNKSIELQVSDPKIRQASNVVTATLYLPDTQRMLNYGEKKGVGRYSWRIVSGDEHYSQDDALRAKRIDLKLGFIQQQGILDVFEQAREGRSHKIKLYKDKNTKIYVDDMAQGTPIQKFTTLPKQAIQKAGNKPVLDIDTEGRATLRGISV